jgi:hypothetical protein
VPLKKGEIIRASNLSPEAKRERDRIVARMRKSCAVLTEERDRQRLAAEYAVQKLRERRALEGNP